MDLSTSLSTVSAQASKRSIKDFIVGFTPDSVLAAVVHQGDKIITVLDLKSGIPWLIINVGIGIYGLGITGSSIVAAGKEGVVTWNLPTGDHIPNLGVDITNSVQAVIFSDG